MPLLPSHVFFREKRLGENETGERAKARPKRRRDAAAPGDAPASTTPAAADPAVEVRPARARRTIAAAVRPTSDREAVLAANATFYHAFELRDLDAMGELWARQPYVRCIHPGWEPLSGWDEVVGSWEQIFQGLETLRFELADVTVRVGGGLAWVELCEKLEAAHEGGVARSQVLATNIFELGADGRWRMIHHHASPVMVKQPVPRRGNESLH